MNLIAIWKKDEVKVNLDSTENKSNVSDNNYMYFYSEWRNEELRTVVGRLTVVHFITFGVTLWCILSSVLALLAVIMVIACCRYST